MSENEEIAVKAHSNDINCCQISYNGIIATGSSDRTVRLWEAGGASGAENSQQITELSVSPLTGHSYGINAVQFSRFGSLVVAASTDGTVSLKDSKTGELLETFYSPSGSGLRACALSPDSNLLVAGGDDDKVYVWSVGERQLLKTVDSHDATVTALAFTPDSAVFISGDASGYLYGWSAAPGHHTKLTAVFEAHDLGVTSADFSPCVRKSALITSYTLVTAGNDGHVKLWTLRTGEFVDIEMIISIEAHSSSAMCAVFSPQGDLLASGGGDKTAKLWSYPNLECKATFTGFSRYVSGCSISRYGDLLATVSSRQLRVFRLKGPSTGESEEGATAQPQYSSTTLQQEARFQHSLAKHRHRPYKCVAQFVLPPAAHDATSANLFDKTLVISSSDNDLHIYHDIDLSSETSQTIQSSNPGWNRLKGHTDSVQQVKFTKQGFLVSCSLNGEIIIWKPSYSTKPLKKLCHPDGIGFRCVEISAGGGLIVAAGSADDTAHVWRLPAGEVLQKLVGAQAGTDNGAAAESVLNTVADLDMEHIILKEHVNTVAALAVTADEELLITGCSGHLIKVWNTRLLDRSIFTVEEAHDLGVTACAFSPRSENDGYVLVSGGNDSIIKVWRISKQGVASLETGLFDHGGSITALSFSADSAVFGSSSEDKTVRLWSRSTFKCIAVVDQQPSYVASCAFAVDASQLFVSCCENTVSCWSFDTSSQGDEYEALSKPIKDWTSREVALWLKELGIDDKSEFLKQVNGPALLQISQTELLDAGYSEETARLLSQNVQWRRHGNVKKKRGSSISEVDTIPSEFICPITQEVMEEPVKLSDGFVYEEIAIKEWLTTRRRTSPMTNLELEDVTLTPCPTIKQAILQYLSNQPQPFV